MNKTNAAAWIEGPKANPLVVKPAPYPSLGPQDAIVKVVAVAINPLEYKIQDYNPPIGGVALHYPTILGADLAGVVVEAGTESFYKIGDRLMTNSSGALTGDPSKSAFQHFTRVPNNAPATRIPAQVPLTAAVVLPLACDTAAAGLFVAEQLGLSTTHLLDHSTPAPGAAILIWGGSSSVGCCAIQMARAAGYEVYTTASPRNHALVTGIGAAHVFDHTDGDVEAKLVEALRGKEVIGAFDCISDPKQTVPLCSRILAATTGPKKVVCVLDPPKEGIAEGVTATRSKYTAQHSHLARGGKVLSTRLLLWPAHTRPSLTSFFFPQ